MTTQWQQYYKRLVDSGVKTCIQTRSQNMCYEIIVHQQAELDSYIASSMRQLSKGRHVIPHYPYSVQPVFVPNPLVYTSCNKYQF
jgi:hypothetical protein